jgi:hypothetical protein
VGKQMKRGKDRKKDNAIARAVASLGGPTRAARVCGVSNAAIHKWIQRGSISLLVHALRLSRATGVPIEQFADEEDQG